MNDLGRLLSYSDLKERGIKFTRQHINRLVKARKFPAPIKLGEATNAFSETEIDAWLKAKAAERNVNTGAAA